MMRICIFGAGALGSAVGGILASKHDVSLVCRRSHSSAMKKNGLRITGLANKLVRVPSFERIEDAPPADLLMITVKAFDTATAIESCRTVVDGSVRVLTLQNGLGNLELLREWKGSKSFGGTTTIGARYVGPGVVELSGFGRTVIGGDRDLTWARRIAEAFSESGIEASVKKDIAREIWSKVVVSACINPLTAILKVPNGTLLVSPTISRLVSEVVKECVRVSTAEGHRLSERASIAHVRWVAKNTSGNRSSMLQDVENGKRTEISMINGAICRCAERRGIPVPLNSSLVAIVESLERANLSEKG